MTKFNGFLVGTAVFFAGVGLGFLLSPAKNGFGNNSGNNIHYHYDAKGSGNPTSKVTEDMVDEILKQNDALASEIVKEANACQAAV